MKDTIKLITNESGDWEVLLLNGKVYEEGHDIPTYTWINLIHDLGHEVSIEDVTDEEMARVIHEETGIDVSKSIDEIEAEVTE